MADELVTTQVTVEPPVSSAPPTPDKDLPPDPAALQAEIDRLAQVRKDAEEKAKAAEEKAVYWRQQKAKERAEFFKSPRETPQPAQPQDLGIGPEPRQENFDDYQKYLDAKMDYKVSQAKAIWDRDQANKEADRNRQSKMASMEDKIRSGFEKYSDFEEVVFDPSAPITQMVAEILAESEMPAEVAYYLGKNKAEGLKIARMTPIQAAREITRIEDRIKATPVPPQPKIPGAPPPIRPLGSSNIVERDPAKMSQKEFEKWRQEQGARRF